MTKRRQNLSLQNNLKFHFEMILLALCSVRLFEIGCEAKKMSRMLKAKSEPHSAYLKRF
jgi:hypothetical protein